MTTIRRLLADNARLLGLLLPGLIALAAAAGTRLRFPPYHDEKYYLPLATVFSRGLSLDLIATYRGIPSALGPVFFSAYGAWFRVWGPSLTVARGLSILWTLAAGVVFGLIGRRLDCRRPMLLGVSFAALPHVLTSSVTFLGEPLALALALAGTWFWLRGVEARRRWDFGLAALFLAVAVNVRLPLLFLPGALALSGIVWVRRWEAVAAPVLAVVAQVPCWVLWHGPLPPTQSQGLIGGVEAAPGLHPETVLHLLTVAGFCFWPALRRCRPIWGLLWMLAGLALYVAFAPDYSFRFAGPLKQLAAVRGGLFRPLVVVACFAGWALLGQRLAGLGDGSRSVGQRTIALVGVAGVGIYLASPLAFERYALTFTPFWLLSAFPDLARRPRLWGGWVAVLFGLAALALRALFA